MRDFFGDVGAGSSEFCAVAFLGGGPDHVAILIDQAHGGQRFVLALLNIGGIVLARAEGEGMALAIARTFRARPGAIAGFATAGAGAAAEVKAFRRLKIVGI